MRINGDDFVGICFERKNIDFVGICLKRYERKI
jgi:hypothetical protein